MKYALLTGAILASIEGTLILGVDPGIDSWHLAQAVLAWFSFGLVVFLAETGLPPIRGSIFLTLVLNSPWYIAESIRPGNLAHLPPLIIASIVSGSLIGALKRKFAARK